MLQAGTTICDVPSWINSPKDLPVFYCLGLYRPFLKTGLNNNSAEIQASSLARARIVPTIIVGSAEWFRPGKILCICTWSKFETKLCLLTGGKFVGLESRGDI